MKEIQRRVHKLTDNAEEFHLKDKTKPRAVTQCCISPVKF